MGERYFFYPSPPSLTIMSTISIDRLLRCDAPIDGNQRPPLSPGLSWDFREKYCPKPYLNMGRKEHKFNIYLKNFLVKKNQCYKPTLNYIKNRERSFVPNWTFPLCDYRTTVLKILTSKGSSPSSISWF